MRYHQTCDRCCVHIPQIDAKDKEHIYCAKCQAEVDARLAAFKKIAPLHNLREPAAAIDGIMPAVIIWPFEVAPQIYQDMSDNGGDEDWIALVPPTISYLPMWLENLDSCQHPQDYEIADGYRIIIGSHA